MANETKEERKWHKREQGCQVEVVITQVLRLNCTSDIITSGIAKQVQLINILYQSTQQFNFAFLTVRRQYYVVV